MDCKRLLEDMNLYIDGELDPELCQQLEAHFKDCERCRIVLDTTRKTIDLYCGNEPVELPADVSSRLHQALHARWKNSSKSKD
jgi:anti-sigma factor RsiW